MGRRFGKIAVLSLLFPAMLTAPSVPVALAPLALGALSRAAARAGNGMRVALTALALPHAALLGWVLGTALPGPDRIPELLVACASMLATSRWFGRRPVEPVAIEHATAARAA